MRYVYGVLYNDRITISMEQPACGISFRWREETLTTENLQRLQKKFPNKAIILTESVVGLVQENDKRAAMPITKGEKKPFDPNSNRLKFELKKVGRKTYSERETKPQQDHIARHRAPLPTDRDRAAAESSSSSTNPYVDFIQEHKSEILLDIEVCRAINKVVLSLYLKEKGHYPHDTKLYFDALRDVFPESFV